MMNTNISFLSWAFYNKDDDLSEKVPRSLLRGMGGFGKFIVSAFLKLKVNGEFFLVLSTQYGNVQLFAKMGRQILYENFCSPVLCSKFPNSVPAGIISIITKNHEEYTTVSSGSRSFEIGLFDALLSLHEDVVYIYAEDDMTGLLTSDVPPPFGAFALHIKKDNSGNFCVKSGRNESIEPRSWQDFVLFLNNKGRKFEAKNFVIERRETNG